MAALVKKNHTVTNSNHEINNQSICAQINTYTVIIPLLRKLHVYNMEPAKT